MFLMLLSFVSGLGVLISFVTGLISYFSDSKYKKWWQSSLILFAVTSVLTLLAAVFDSESGVSVAFVILWIYVSLLMFAFILVYIIKRIRRDEIKGYKKRIGITFITGFILFFIVAATGNGPENVEREMNEAAATVEEVTEEETVDSSISEEELQEERKALDAEKEEIAAERRKLEKEKSIEQEKKEKEEQ